MHMIVGRQGVSRRNVAFAALLLGMLMASLDTNVVVAALPLLGASLGLPDEVAGVTAAYPLAVAVATPLHGYLGDRFGRRATFAASVAVFGIGSAACALAPSMTALIAFRAVQGLGGSGLIVAAVAAMADLFSREEMVARQSWMTAMFAVSQIGGAPIGGFVAGGLGWRWIFVINLPICLVALALGAGSVPGPHRAAEEGGPPRFDASGALAVTVAGTSIVVLGSSKGLAVSPVWAPLLAAVAIAAGIGFVRTQRRGHTPLIPTTVFTDPGLARSMAVTALSGIALFGSFTFVPLALDTGTSNHASITGLLLLPMSIGQLIFTSGFALLARRKPSITWWGRLGLALGVVGMAAMASVPTLAPGTLRTGLGVVGLALAGAALGLSMQAYTLIGQGLAPKASIGATMASLTFSRQIGGSLGIAIFGWAVLLLTGTTGLIIVFALAAIALAIALVAAPRAAHDDSDSQPHEGRHRPLSDGGWRPWPRFRRTQGLRVPLTAIDPWVPGEIPSVGLNSGLSRGLTRIGTKSSGS